MIDSYCTDKELFQLFKQGCPEAFQELYVRHWPGLLREANRQTGSVAESKDMVQDIFLSLFQKAADIDIKVSLKAYLYRTLRYKILNCRRNEKIHAHCHNEIFKMRTNSPMPASELETKELATGLNQAIAALPKKCKEVFLLSREENYSHKNISYELKISVSTVEKHIVKALKIIKNEMYYSGLVAVG